MYIYTPPSPVNDINEISGYLQVFHVTVNIIHSCCLFYFTKLKYLCIFCF